MDARRRLGCSLAVGICVLCLGVHPLSGQTTGSIDGRVLDATLAPLPGVTVRNDLTAPEGIR
jgi:hypothetical protein